MDMPRSRITHALLLVLLSVAASTEAAAQLAGSTSFEVAGTTAEEVDTFMDDFRAALKAADRDRIATMFSYPARVAVGRNVVTLRRPRDLSRHFSRLFDERLRGTIARATAATAWANYRGVMFENGRVWLAVVGDTPTLKVVTINPPRE